MCTHDIMRKRKIVVFLLSIISYAVIYYFNDKQKVIRNTLYVTTLYRWFVNFSVRIISVKFIKAVKVTFKWMIVAIIVVHSSAILG